MKDIKFCSELCPSLISYSQLSVPSNKFPFPCTGFAVDVVVLSPNTFTLRDWTGLVHIDHKSTAKYRKIYLVILKNIFNLSDIAINYLITEGH